MRSLLYNKLVADDRFISWREAEWISSSLNFLEPECAKEKMITLKKYMREVNASSVEISTKFEIFAKDGAGNLWLENQNNGVTTLFIFQKGY